MADKTQTPGTQSSEGTRSGTTGAGQVGESGRTATTTERPDAFADPVFDRFNNETEGFKLDDVAGEVKRLSAFEAAENLRKASIPANPDEYKLDLPAEFKLPEGITEFKFDENDPRLPVARKTAQELGLDQKGFSRLLAIQAQYDIGEQVAIAKLRKQEIGKLGANGPARVDAITAMLVSQVGEEKGRGLMQRLFTQADFESVEDLLKKITTQGAAPYSQKGRENGSELPRKTPEQRMYPTMYRSN